MKFNPNPNFELSKISIQGRNRIRASHEILIRVREIKKNQL